jgi:membrane protein
MHPKGLIGLVKKTASGWYGGHPFELGAALAFYGAFALAPTLVIAVALAGIFFGEEAAQGQLAASLEVALGPVVAKAFAETLTYVYVSQSGWIATLVGLGVVVFAATGMFIQLQMSLNEIWEVQPKPGRDLWDMVRTRFLAFVLVLSFGGLLLLLLIADAVLRALHALLPKAPWSVDAYLWEGGEWLLLICLLTLLFSLIYKLLPDAIITWRAVWGGAFITAVLFGVGSYLVAYYLGRVAPTFTYGAAGSLVMVMLWVYFSSQVVLFGAELTKNVADAFGEPVRPAAYARYLPRRTGTGQEGTANQPGPSQSPCSPP